MSKHTPGPWMVAGESGDYFATAADYSPLPATAENARLIAAAPELLGALCALVLGIDAGGATLDDMREARAAIAKAEGANDE